ncbi:type II toxin-antitoxin system TacA family antitoxin [Singulisphaera acidiphila]|uniref:type II toxin-antitoxin system TacA family antitoxin n=1 Tax=Singulisphaera acidiphila TaxID=466153 RepID=UPI0015756613
MSERSVRSAKLDLRLSPEAKETLQAAAQVAHRSVSEFVLESALERAGETLASRTRFGLDAERWQAFLTALDAPPRELPRLSRLFQEPGPFDGGSRPWAIR